MESSRTALRLALTTAITLISVSAYAATQAPGAAAAQMPPPPAATAMPRIGHATLKHFVTAIRRVSQIRATYAKKLQAMKAKPGAARGIQVRAQKSMIAAIKGQHLTLPQYNNLVRQVDASPALRARVLHMLH